MGQVRRTCRAHIQEGSRRCGQKDARVHSSCWNSIEFGFFYHWLIPHRDVLRFTFRPRTVNPDWCPNRAISRFGGRSTPFMADSKKHHEAKWIAWASSYCAGLGTRPLTVVLLLRTLFTGGFKRLCGARSLNLLWFYFHLLPIFRCDYIGELFLIKRFVKSF